MRKFMGQEGSQARGHPVACPFRNAGILEEPLIQGALGPPGGGGGRAVEHDRRGPALQSGHRMRVLQKQNKQEVTGEKVSLL